jgi:hypothetical protein
MYTPSIATALVNGVSWRTPPLQLPTVIEAAQASRMRAAVAAGVLANGPSAASVAAVASSAAVPPPSPIGARVRNLAAQQPGAPTAAERSLLLSPQRSLAAGASSSLVVPSSPSGPSALASLVGLGSPNAGGADEDGGGAFGEDGGAHAHAHAHAPHAATHGRGRDELPSYLQPIGRPRTRSSAHPLGAPVPLAASAPAKAWSSQHGGLFTAPPGRDLPGPPRERSLSPPRSRSRSPAESPRTAYDPSATAGRAGTPPPPVESSWQPASDVGADGELQNNGSSGVRTVRVLRAAAVQHAEALAAAEQAREIQARRAAWQARQ